MVTSYYSFLKKGVTTLNCTFFVFLAYYTIYEGSKIWKFELEAHHYYLDEDGHVDELVGVATSGMAE